MNDESLMKVDQGVWSDHDADVLLNQGHVREGKEDQREKEM